MSEPLSPSILNKVTPNCRGILVYSNQNELPPELLRDLDYLFNGQLRQVPESIKGSSLFYTQSFGSKLFLCFIDEGQEMEKTTNLYQSINQVISTENSKGKEQLLFAYHPKGNLPANIKKKLSKEFQGFKIDSLLQ